MAKTAVQEFTKGLWAKIPPFRLVLGLCPTLAVTKGVENGIGMGIATTFVLVCSNVLISLLRNVIPKRVRNRLLHRGDRHLCHRSRIGDAGIRLSLFLKLGIFIPLIVVNCIVLGRAEAFAAKNGVVHSFADGLGIGVGFTLSLTALSIVREVLGNGTFYDIPVFGPSFEPFGFMVQAPGAFVCLGLMLCVMNMLGKMR
ncbi:MAG: Rnf-Nqr domain containing protein [Deltaproteobacteria bacterium]|nr:Rnf-Nqr domain containing protein [Deltaproteobacteria bacterium]